jgi:hypothetical protein
MTLIFLKQSIQNLSSDNLKVKNITFVIALDLVIRMDQLLKYIGRILLLEYLSYPKE